MLEALSLVSASPPLSQSQTRTEMTYDADFLEQNLALLFEEGFLCRQLRGRGRRG
jgi:hypothetical protein